MPRLSWSPSAILDVQRCYKFLKQNNAEAAKKAVLAIQSQVRMIAKYPEIGRTKIDMNSEYREWLIAFGDSGYIALYRFEHDVVTILAVRHQKEVGY